MGIKGTVRRSQDGHIIHANVDTDIIVSEEFKYGSDQKPEELYHMIEHFALGRRRLELFGEDHNVRPGWVTVGLSLSASNFSPQVGCDSVKLGGILRRWSCLTGSRLVTACLCSLLSA